MNNYIALRKVNRMRTKLLTEESQAQLKEVIRYLRRVSWDFCGIELVRSDLLDISIQANAENQELFHSISDAKTFVDEVKPSLKTLGAGDYFWFVAPLYFFWGWGVEGLILYPLVPWWVFEFSLGHLMRLVVAMAAFCGLFRRMMEQVGFPPREHWIKYIGWLVLYIAALYGTGWCFYEACRFHRATAAADPALCAVQPFAGRGTVWDPTVEIWKRPSPYYAGIKIPPLCRMEYLPIWQGGGIDFYAVRVFYFFATALR